MGCSNCHGVLIGEKEKAAGKCGACVTRDAAPGTLADRVHSEILSRKFREVPTVDKDWTWELSTGCKADWAKVREANEKAVENVDRNSDSLKNFKL